MEDLTPPSSDTDEIERDQPTARCRSVTTVTRAFDLAACIDALFVALGPRIADLEAVRRHVPITTAAYIARDSAVRQVRLLRHAATMDREPPCDLGKLAAIKDVFEAPREKGAFRGLYEHEFLELVAPVLCPTYPDGAREWFCTLDTTETGTVDWAKISQHLIGRGFVAVDSAAAVPSASPSGGGGAVSSADAVCPLFEETPTGHSAPPTGFSVIQASAIGGSTRTQGYLGRCTDGAVRIFSREEPHPIHVMHHADKQAPLIDVRQCDDRAIVGDESGVVLLYSVDGACTRSGNISRAFRLVHDRSVAALRIQKTVKYDVLKMERPGMCMSVTAHPPFVPVDLALTPLQTGVDMSREALSAVELVRGTREPHFMVGFSSGHVSMYTPEPLALGPIAPAMALGSIHRGRVTCLRHVLPTGGAMELRGLISAGLDGNVIVTDLEKHRERMRFAPRSDAFAGDERGLCAISRLAVSGTHPLLAASGPSRYVAVWSGQSRRQVAALADHRAEVLDLCFNATHELVTLSRDRTMRVYDIRTWQPVQTIVDKGRRYTGDPLAACCTDEQSNAIVTFAGRPFVHRPVAGTLALLTHGNPVTFAHDALGEAGQRVAVVRGSLFEMIHSGTGDLLYKFAARGPIRSVAWDPSWQRVFLLSDTALEVVVVGQRAVSRVFEMNGEATRAVAFLPATSSSGALIVTGTRLAVQFLAERNTSGTLQPQHVVLLASWSRSRDRGPPEVVTALSVVPRRSLVAAGAASGEVAILEAAWAKVSVLFVFTIDAKLSRAVAAMHRDRPVPDAVRSLWRTAVTATAREHALGASAFTRFRHDCQQLIRHQCDSLCLISDLHVLIGFGCGDAAICALAGDNSKFVARFPATYSPGTGCVFAVYGGTTVVCGDDEGYVSRFSIAPTAPFTGVVTKRDRYFRDCPVALRRVVRLGFAVTALAVTPSAVLVGLDCGQVLGLDAEMLGFLWRKDDLVRVAPKAPRPHYFTRIFGDDEDDGEGGHGQPPGALLRSPRSATASTSRLTSPRPDEPCALLDDPSPLQRPAADLLRSWQQRRPHIVAASRAVAESTAALERPGTSLMASLARRSGQLSRHYQQLRVASVAVPRPASAPMQLEGSAGPLQKARAVMDRHWHQSRDARTTGLQPPQ